MASTGERLAAALAGRDLPPPGWGPARLVVAAVALLLHLTALAALAGGAWLVARDFPSFTILPGVVLLAFGVLLLPRPESLPRYSTRLDRTRAPHLFAFVAAVAGAAGVPVPHLIVVDDTFDADGGTTGLRRRRYLRLGLPLLAVLDAGQCTALVAHQLAHTTTGNPLRTGLTGSADRSLTALMALFEPGPDTALRALQDPAIVKAGMGTPPRAANGNVADVWYAELLIRPVLAALRGLAAAGRRLLLTLAAPDVHRAEYRADAVAAGVAGTAATLELLDVLALRETVLTVLRRHIRAAADDRPDPPAWRTLAADARRHSAAALPALRAASPFADHPPLEYRTRLLRSRPAVAPMPEPPDPAGVDADLAEQYRRMVRDLRFG
ncbi:hypothetical protein [Dactylosporangium sp. NPDC051541]|uniref:hypothetical protein n=1 Tax=Dactylosporangium sp. NPDC051541 TaxID=3363977 RepID=UPI00379C884C